METKKTAEFLRSSFFPTGCRSPKSGEENGQGHLAVFLRS